MQKRACIALVDAAHARIFTYSELPGQDPEFVEIADLTNPGRQAHGYFAERASRAPGVTHHTKDDHRTDHIEELEARFVRDVMADLTKLVREQAFEHVIFVASPKMLAKLRVEAAPLAKQIVIDELAQDLAWMTAPQVHDHLAAQHVVAPRNARTR
jgi:protein required for attachment to host cells